MERSFGGVTGRIILVYIVIAVGLCLGAAAFLWFTDYFEPSGDDFGSAIFGGLTVGAVLVFGLLSGVIIAALGGLYSASALRGRGSAVGSSVIAGAVGHASMVAILVLFLNFGVDYLSSLNEKPESADASASPSPEPSSTVDPECAETFGADAAICNPEKFASSIEDNLKEESPNNEEEQEDIDSDHVLRLGAGVLPAALVGGISAALLYSRKSSTY